MPGPRGIGPNLLSENTSLWGHFTMSLKNSVRLVAKLVPGEGYNYMGELHSSLDQRIMITEINSAYQLALVVLDGVEAFVSRGSGRGKLV